MNSTQFDQAIKDFDKGKIPFNHGKKTVAILYSRKWYPLNALVKHATNKPEITTNESRKVISSLMPYTRFKEDIDFSRSNGQPIKLTTEELMEEVRLLNHQLSNIIG